MLTGFFVHPLVYCNYKTLDIICSLNRQCAAVLRVAVVVGASVAS